MGTWYLNQAGKQYETQVAIAPDQAAGVVLEAFGDFLWRDVSGPGDINRQRRTINASGPVVSVSVQGTEDGGSLVKTWISQWTRSAGPGDGPAKMRKIIKRLEQAQAAITG